MKNSYPILSLLTLTLFSSLVSFSQPTYCTSGLGGGGCGGYITNVTIAGTTLNNSSTCSTLPDGGAYSSYSASGSSTATLILGSTYSLSVTTNENDIISVWIDYNINGTYETTEWAQLTTSSTAYGTTTLSITIPANATPGLTGMRIRSRQSGNTNTSTSSCLSFGSGEAEEYFITLASPATSITSLTSIVGNYKLYPNPSSDEVNLEYLLTNSGVVSVEVFNSIGEKVAVIVKDSEQTSGNFSYKFKLDNDGLYMVRLKVNDQIYTEKLKLIK